MRLIVSALIISIVLAGCSSTNAPADDAPGIPSPAAPDHILDGSIEPTELLAPTFKLLGAVAKGGPLYGAGEPSITGAMDGSIYIAFPGCDDGPYYFVSYPNAETCGHGLVWKSIDDGESWERLNRRPDGRLTHDGPAANGDADVTVDSAGTIYTSNLGGGGIQFHSSSDGGATWAYVANVVPPTENPDDDPEAREGADRQWLAAAGPGHVINTWMRTSPSRDVAINTTFDGGMNWTGRANFGSGIGWLGTVAFAPDGMHAYIPYTQPLEGLGVGLGVSEIFEMHVIRTADGGLTWEDVPTGMTWRTTATGVHWSGGHMAPTLDVTGDGTVVVGMAVDNYVAASDPAGAGAPTNQGSYIMVSTSSDAGATWGSQTTIAPGHLGVPTLSEPSAAIFPWIIGGAGDRFAVTYYHSLTPADQDVFAGIWDLRVAVVDGAADGELVVVDTLLDDDVHEGPICTRGGVCGGPADRTLLDFFESDITPDGRIIVVYPADPAEAGKDIELRVAIQNGGTPLLLRPAS